MRTLVRVVDAVSLFACILAACPSSPGSTGGTDGGGDDAPGHTPGMPGLGAHALVYYGLRTNKAPSITTKGSRPNRRVARSSSAGVGGGSSNSRTCGRACAPRSTGSDQGCGRPVTASTSAFTNGLATDEDGHFPRWRFTSVTIGPNFFTASRRVRSVTRQCVHQCAGARRAHGR